MDRIPSKITTEKLQYWAITASPRLIKKWRREVSRDAIPNIIAGV
jgi:hypothetical protein